MIRSFDDRPDRTRPVPVPASGMPAYPVRLPAASCRMCGSQPAIPVKFRQHTGMLVLMRFGRYEGPFCRDCGLHVFRRATGHTLLAGSWGWGSFFITPVTILINLFRRGKVARLAAPVPLPGGPRPADPGKPLYQRFAIAGVLAPLLVVGAFIAIGSSSGSGDGSGPIGRCVQVEPDGQHVSLVDCGQPHEGVVTKVVSRPEDCPADATDVLTATGSSGKESVLCVGHG
jgi:hypothetical protein